MNDSAMPLLLRSRQWGVNYSREDGDLAQLVLRPALAASVRYDRSVGYFSAYTFVLAADGLEGLVRNGGSMRMVIGSLMSEDEALAIERGEREAKDIANEKCRASLSVPPGVAYDAIELLAWLVANSKLQIKFALPRRSQDGILDLGHIFHQKTAVFTDIVGDQIAFNGSINETPAGWTANWESLLLFHSWNQHKGILDSIVSNFEDLWNGRMKTAYVVDIPTALKEQLITYVPLDGAIPKRLTVPETAVLEPSPVYMKRSWREVRSFLSDTPALERAVGIGARTSAIEPWPHQWRAYRRMYEPWSREGRYPRLLIADEVGLGKTIEAGLLLRQAWLSGKAKRILVLTPSGVMRQWQRELREKFALNWPIYDKDEFVYYGSSAAEVERRRPILGDWSREPFVIASSHLMRRAERQVELLDAEPWDLIIVDEAHHARREAAGTNNEGEPNRLLSLLQSLSYSGRLRGLVLLSATPMQTAMVELFDLLNVLGLPYPWNDRSTFEHFFHLFRKSDLTSDDVQKIAGLIIEGADEMPEGHSLIGRAIEDYSTKEMGGLSGPAKSRIIKLFRENTKLYARQVHENNLSEFMKVARTATPVAALLSRHTRRLLRRYDVHIAQREARDYMVERTPEEQFIAGEVERFIRTEYNRAKNVKDGRKRNAIGFVLSLYGKRLASSLEALHITLQRHLTHIQQHVLDGDSAKQITLALSENIDEDQVVGLVQIPTDAEDARKIEIEGLAAIESVEIEKILHLVEAFTSKHDDAKLTFLRRCLSDLKNDGFDQAIIFTQYTDTLDWLKRSFAGSRILCYSGRGGEFLNAIGEWEYISRDDTKQRFASKKADILICTDAAAEGLNLQTCGALINFDLPWNPMRVEQRIGRIDRIGQKRPVIKILNLYYTGTIETEVYRRLQGRIELFGDVVGRLQPILGRTAAFIERAILEGDSTAHILSELEAQVSQCEPMEPDLDEVSPSLIDSAGDIPAVPYDLSQLALLLEMPDSLPSSYKVKLLDESQWIVERAGDTTPVRVSTKASFYEQHLGDVQLWTPGSPIFPELDEPTAAEHEEYTLRDLLRTPVIENS